MPDWVRIQPTTWLSRSETKNMRSASLRCAIETMATRGLPSGVCRSASTSRGSPSIQAPKPGAASRLLSDIARAKRSLDGKNASRSSTPTRFTGGVWICWMRPARSSSCPWRHAVSRMVAIRMCSRLLIGSASMPSRPRRLVAVVPMRSRSSSSSSRMAGGGAANDLRIESGMPALLPGV